MYYELKAARTQKKRVLINITPLIDVLFLLLIFFIVSSTFIEQPSIAVELPAAHTAEAVRIEPYVITVDKESTLFIDETRCDATTLYKRLEEICHSDPDASVMLKADKHAPYGTIIEVVDTVRKSGLKRIIAFTHIPEEQ